MVGKERWGQIQQLYSVEGMSISQIARVTDLDRKTVRRCVRKAQWQAYQRQAGRQRAVRRAAHHDRNAARIRDGRMARHLRARELQARGRFYTGLLALGIQDCAIQESMGPIADRTKEFLLFGDMVIVKIRRLLLQTLADHAAGKPLPCQHPASYRVRSATFRAPKGVPFSELVDAHSRIETAAGTSEEPQAVFD